MLKTARQAALLATVLGALCVPARVSLAADGMYDGLWKARILVDNVDQCGGPPFHTYLVRISHGELSIAKEMTSSRATLTGRVDSNKVRAVGLNGQDHATAEGEFASPTTGNGTWKALTRECRGTWIVTRIGN